MSGTGASDAGREFIVGDAELVEQLLIGGRLFQRVQLGSVNVLEQGVPKHALVGGLADDRGDGREAGLLGGAPAALPHDELIPTGGLAGHCTDHDRLHEAELADGVHELGERLLVEDLARLPRVRIDRRRVDLAVDRADVVGVRLTADDDVGCRVTHPPQRRLVAVGRAGGDERRQTAAETAALAFRLGHLDLLLAQALMGVVGSARSALIAHVSRLLFAQALIGARLPLRASAHRRSAISRLASR